MKVKFGATNCFGDYAKVIECDRPDRGGTIYLTTEGGTKFYFPGYFEVRDGGEYAKMNDTALIKLE